MKSEVLLCTVSKHRTIQRFLSPGLRQNDQLLTTIKTAIYPKTLFLFALIMNAIFRSLRAILFKEVFK